MSTFRDDPRILAGLRLHWLGRYWESHDVLEPVWRGAPYPERDALKAAIQVGAAVIHAAWGDPQGTAAILARTLPLLDSLPASCLGLDLIALRRECEALLAQARRVEASGTGEIDPALAPRLVPAGVDADALMEDGRYEVVWLPQGRNAYRLAGIPLDQDPR
jgi:hypothetical protein